MIPAAHRPSVKAGKMRCVMPPMPAAGSQPSRREKTKMRRRPSQKLGTETPSRATIMPRLSSQEL
jgi:hypothetical protein